jgi:S-layer homology domain
LAVVNVPIILHVQQGSFPTSQFFGHVEVWWKRRVSDSFTVSFDDVPVDHPFRQFIGALAASGITAGCGNGNFCPDNPLTRGQMAVFLAKALGLHWGWPANP